MGKRNSRFNYLFIKPTGFTLIEILIGLSIFTIIITSIYATFRQGISVFRRSEEKIALYQEVRLALEEICSAIRNTVSLGAEKFEGNSTSLNFVTIDAQKQILSKITYQWDKNRLLKRVKFLTWVENEDLEEEMIESITKVDFKYLGFEDDTWFETWNEAKHPKAVRLVLEVDKKIFTTIAWIPTWS